jgi:hypothetical protein
VQKPLSFGDKLRQKVGPILEEAGFRITVMSTAPIEAITYQRQIASRQKPDRVNFHGTEDGQNHIYSQAISSQGELKFLTTIKLLSTSQEVMMDEP